MSSHKLYIIRHGQTDWNAAGRFQGQRDIPINAVGRQQAKRNGELLAGLLKDPAAPAYVASPLARTRETMEIIRQTLGLPASGYGIDGRLKEVSYGAWEGYTTDEIRALVPDDRRTRRDDKFNYVPPRGESYAMLLDRIKAWLPYLEQDTVCVAHGGVIRVLLHHLGGMDPLEAVRSDVPQDQVLLWDGQECRWVS